MAIRFHCSQCGQAIEIDDEWAQREVACPYCEKTIRAPAASTIGQPSEMPTASPISEGQITPDSVPGMAPPPVPPASSNRLAVVSLVLGCAVLVQVVWAGMILAGHSMEFEMVQERAEELRKEGMGQVQASQKALAEFYKDYGGMPPGWMIASGSLFLTSLLTWLATLICALIAVRRPVGRGFAVAALLLAGLIPILFCCGPFAIGPEG